MVAVGFKPTEIVSTTNLRRGATAERRARPPANDDSARSWQVPPHQASLRDANQCAPRIPWVKTHGYLELQFRGSGLWCISAAAASCNLPAAETRGVWCISAAAASGTLPAGGLGRRTYYR
jgi:hypothetical protein